MSSRCRFPTVQATSTQNILIQAAVQPVLPSVTIVLTPSFPAIPGQQVMINAIASSVAPITESRRHPAMASR